MDNLKVHDDFIAALSGLPYEDIVEILANTFLTLGFNHMYPSEEEIQKEKAFEKILDHRKTYGETLGSALATQGFVMLAWLSSE